MIGEERKLCPAEPIQSRNAKLSNLLTTLVHHMCSETHLSISDITTFYLISDNTPSPSRYYSMVVFDEHICLIIAKLTVYKFNLDQSWHLHQCYLCLLIAYLSSILFQNLSESLVKTVVNLLFILCPQPPICSLIVRGEGKLETAEIEMEKEVFRAFGVSNIRTEYLGLKNMLQSLGDEIFQALLPILGTIESFSSLER